MMPRFRFDDPWRVLWRMVSSDYLLGAVLLALALALLLAAWLPQTSPGGLNSDVVWQAEVQRRFGGVAWFDTVRPPLQAMGAFHISDAVIFRLLLALLAFAFLARLVDSVERLWQGWRRRASATEKQVNGGKPGEEQTASSGRASGLPWGELGPAGVYLGGLTVLLGAAIASVWGWQLGPFVMTAGESVPLGHETDLVFRLDSLAPDGRRGLGELWRGGDTLVNAGELAVGQPLEGDGVGMYLVGSGDALQLQATTGDGQPLELVMGPDTTAEKEPVLTFTEDEPRHLVGVPDASLVLLLTMPEAEQKDVEWAPQVQVFESGSGELIPEPNRPDDTTLIVDDVSFVLTPLPYAEIRAVYDRGALWIRLGVIGLIIGGVLWGWRSRRKTDVDSSAVGVETTDDGSDEGMVSLAITSAPLALQSDEGGA